MESVFPAELPRLCWGDLKRCLDGELSGQSFHHLIMQRGDVLVRDAVMNGISNTCTVHHLPLPSWAGDLHL